MGILDLGRRILDKKIDERARAAATPASRVDDDLPLGVRVGSLLEIPRASFAVLDGSLLQTPSAAQMQITAISRLRFEADPVLKLFRFYTDCGADRKGEGESFLQVLCMGSDIQEMAYYQFLERQIPVTAEEQEPFLGKGYGMGESSYFMAADQLQSLGLTETQIAALLGETDALEFKRDAGGASEYVPPFVCRETRIDDPYGEKGLRQQVRFMTYLRQLPDGNAERLLISFEAIESVDGLKRPAVHVDFMVGLELDRQKVKVL